ncbi:MAG: RDD family protein [Elusimicrobia bacterium]|nr:RDD family protein [Elusimicrobiota bacterium]MDE2424277.1 RDD family protein [Elusimicrobiota bacterium]
MNKLATALLSAGLILGPTSLRARAQEARDHVSIGHGATLAAGEAARDLVVVAGSATVAGTVTRDLVVVGGDAQVAGNVGRDLVVLGSARLGPNATIGRDTVVLGGTLDAAPGAAIEGRQTVLSLASLRPSFSSLKRWVLGGPLEGRPLAAGLWWNWLLAAVFGLLYVLIAAAAPEAVEACANNLAARPVGATLAGILGLSGLAPCLFLLLVSVVGIAAIPLLLLCAAGAVLLGKAGLCRWLGAKVRIQSPLPATAAGAALLAVLYAVPAAGLLACVIALVLAFGAALLTGVEMLRGESAKAAAHEPPAPATAPADKSVPAATAAASAQEIALPRAGFWLRLGAQLIDAFAFIVIGGVTHLLFLGLGGWALYQVGLWTWKGTTFGGMVVGIKGVRLDGRPMDLSVALIRHLASYLSALPLLLGFFWAGWDADKQTWHDKIAGTLVVRAPRGQPLI